MNKASPELSSESETSPSETEENVKGSFQIRCARKNPLIVGNTIFKSITDFELTSEEMEKAHIELGETDEVRKDCLRKLKRMLSDDKSVRYRTDDQYLLRYLRVSKFNCEKAYNSLKKFYYLKKNCTEAFDIPSNLKSLLDIKMASALPYTDKDGRIIIWADFGQWKPEEMPIKDALGRATCFGDIISMNPRGQVNGVILIYNMKELNISQFSLLFKRLPTVASLILNCYPWRIKHVFLMNTGQLTRLIYSAFRPFLTKKIKERIFLLGSDFSVLHEYISPEILPLEYGGKLEEEKCTMSQLILENIRYIEYERSFF